MTTVPILDLYINPAQHLYLIQNYMKHPKYGYSMATGDFVRLSAEIMKTQGLEVILANLYDYMDRVQEKSALEKMTRQEEAELYSNFYVFVLAMRSPNILTITPMEVNEDGSGQGISSREFNLKLPSNTEELMSVLSRSVKNSDGSKSER